MAADRPLREEPIAIVGAAAFMPGSADLDGFWRTLLTGRDMLTDVPADRWLVDDYYDPDPRAADKTYARRGAFLDAVAFDPVGYGIPPNSLPAIDTSQLLALMVADRVLADCAAGLPDNRDRISVLLGVSSLQLLVEASARLHRPVWLRALRAHGVPEPQAESICDSIAASFVPWQEETFPGLLTNVVSGRIANKFDLHGTNHTTDAACASSLAALNSAVAELSLHQADLVITGGVDTMNDVLMYTCFSRTPALSPTGDCRPFSSAADGTMLGEGVVMFALKRRDDAERDGDRIYAVIRGVGSSSDGRGTAIYAPLAEGQMRALRRAYDRAGYGPETVELVEAHGTGTIAGDAAEFEALSQVFQESGRSDRQWCALGSVKSQVGHTKAAAGAAGLLKAVLALHHKVLPPTIKVDKPNPALGLDDSPFYLNTGARPWIRPGSASGAEPRRASVSSFGFGGTNFHVTLEEYIPEPGAPGRPARRQHATPTELILISADDPAQLLDQARRLDLSGPLAEVARRSQQAFESAAGARLAVVARDADDLATKLAAAAPRIEDGQQLPGPGQVRLGVGPSPAGQVGFLFPGQGAQYVGMGADLAIHLPAARAAWDAAAELELGDIPLHRVVFPPPAFAETDRAAQQARLTATQWAQPALAMHSVAMLAVLGQLSIAPDCVAGHSFGELIALHAAGAFDSETLLRLARARGELMRDAAAVPGSMLAVTAARDQAESVLAGLPEVWLANHNAPDQVVFAGTRPALDTAAARLAEHGIATVRLSTATAFHSPLVAPAAEPLLDVLRQADVRAPALDAFAGRDARVYPADPDEVRLGLAAQIAAPVDFVAVIEAMYERGVRTFVEVGPGAALSGLVGKILGDREHVAVNLDRNGQHGITSLQDGLGRLAVHGLAINFGALWEGDMPAESVRASVRHRTQVPIDGGNVGRPYPGAAPAGSHPPAEMRQERAVVQSANGSAPPAEPAVQAAPAAALGAPQPAGPAVPAGSAGPAVPTGPAVAIPDVRAVDGDPDWLRVIEQAQAQTAHAHAEFQRAMTESHVEFLSMAEATFAGLLGAASGRGYDAHPDGQTAWQVPAESPADPPAVVAAAIVEEPAAIVEEPPALPLAEPAQAEQMDADSLGQLLLEVVAERTGYPVDMLNVDMELDTDLGIDSIKKVEILSVVRARVGDVPDGDISELATLRTLRAIAERVAVPRPLPAGPAALLPDAGSPAGPAADPRPTAPGTVASAADDSVVTRWAVRAVSATPSGLSMLWPADGLVAVTDDRTGIAPLVADMLGQRGIRALVVADVPADASGLVALEGLRQVTSVDEAVEIQRSVFGAARLVASRMEEAGGIFVTVQDTGGDFGLTGSHRGTGRAGTGPAQAWLGGLAALAKSAAREWQQASVKAIDCAVAGRPAAEVAGAIVTELLTGGGAGAVGLRADGTRLVPDVVALPAARSIHSQAHQLTGPQPVIVAAGGARGVTGIALRVLASGLRARLVLIGRTELAAEPAGLPAAATEHELIRILARREPGTPAEIAAAARRVLAVREIRGTLAAIERTGAQVRYYALDVTDTTAVTEALAEVRSDWGPITGIVHGAGVLADALIRDKTDEQFARVFGTKVDGLRALLTATAADPLTVLCAFSSAAGQFGNAGQSDYAMANEVLNHVLSAQQVSRPGCLVRAIGWGPWRGGMVTEDIASRFAAAGVPLIEPGAGARAFRSELELPAGDVRVIRSAGTDVPAAWEDSMAAQLTVTGRAHSYLADHQLAGQPVVPVSLVLHWFAAAARAWRPAACSVGVRELRVLEKISLPQLDGCARRLVLRGHPASVAGGQVLSLELRGDTGHAHYRASIAGGPAPAPRRWTAPGGLLPVSHPYDGRTLFHGPRFQAIQGEPAVSAGGAECLVAGAPGLGWDEAAWHVDPAALDGALQLAVLWAQHAGAGPTLPMAIGECRIHRFGAVEDTARCVVLARRCGDSTAVCDVAVIDPDGVPRTELLDVELVRRPR